MSLTFAALIVSIGTYFTCAVDQAIRGAWWVALMYVCYGFANVALLMMTK